MCPLPSPHRTAGRLSRTRRAPAGRLVSCPSPVLCGLAYLPSAPFPTRRRLSQPSYHCRFSGWGGDEGRPTGGAAAHWAGAGAWGERSEAGARRRRRFRLLESPATAAAHHHCSPRKGSAVRHRYWTGSAVGHRNWSPLQRAGRSSQTQSTRGRVTAVKRRKVAPPSAHLGRNKRSKKG